MNACRKPPKIANAINGSGSINGAIPKKITISNSSAKMLPHKRMVSDSGRARWLISSMVSSMGHQRDGAHEMLQVLPYPMLPHAGEIVINKNESAQPAGILALLVGDPSRELIPERCRPE
jgi:hypothetical protein